MALTTKDLAVLKVLAEKELENLEKDQEDLVIANSPFLNKEGRDDSDLEFLKNAELYRNFLQELIQKL